MSPRAASSLTIARSGTGVARRRTRALELDFGPESEPGRRARPLDPELIADRIRQYHEVGVDLILAAFLHYEDELPRFGETVIPLVRRERAKARTDLWSSNGAIA
jgi:alkanesulfonate monooxygenase SsuD/methylene tetrahydromethanopterin reductase-like flavin-dependent oxidoreductase (luciferase family)